MYDSLAYPPEVLNAFPIRYRRGKVVAKSVEINERVVDVIRLVGRERRPVAVLKAFELRVIDAEYAMAADQRRLRRSRIGHRSRVVPEHAGQP